jgi:PAS domain S-box-containing protein
MSAAAVGRQEYFERLDPLFNRLRGDCNNLLQINQKAMVAKSEAAAGAAQRWFLATLVVAGSLVVAGIIFAVFLANRIVRPLSELTEATARIGAGDLDAKADVKTRDEVGILAAGFNTMAERIRLLRRSDMGKLVVAQQTIEAAIDSLYDPVIITDAEGAVTKLNPAAEEIFGSEARNAGKHIEEVARDSRIAMAVSEALRSQRPVAGEGAASVLPLAVDGLERAFRLRTTPMRDEEGRLLGAVTLLDDITHLREIDRVKSEFIATASHELRTPLTSVQMSVHLLLEGAAGGLADKQRAMLQACREDCERLEKLMRDLLDLSRIEAGKSVPQLSPVRVGDLIAVSAESLRPQVEAKGIAFGIEAPAELPSVLADRPQIERVIMNLVSNAVRHTESGGSIRVQAMRRDGHVAVSVTDTGRGIPAEYLPRIFETFAQVPGGPSGGAGLGLAISKRIVEAHGGQIVVKSVVGRGTTFTFTLRVADS